MYFICTSILVSQYASKKIQTVQVEWMCSRLVGNLHCPLAYEYLIPALIAPLLQSTKYNQTSLRGSMAG